MESWDAYNELLLHGSTDRFTKLFARYELFKRVIDVPGDIVECGVFKGTGILFWARLVKLMNPISARKVVGFDTFEGFPESLNEFDKAAGTAFNLQSNSKGFSEDFIYRCAEEIDVRDRVELVAGDACVTIRAFLSDKPGFRAALVNFDMDVYEPTLAALEALWPVITPGGVLVFDEYAAREWGESNAVDHFCSNKGIKLRCFPWAMSPTAYAIKQPLQYGRQ